MIIAIIGRADVVACVSVHEAIGCVGLWLNMDQSVHPMRDQASSQEVTSLRR